MCTIIVKYINIAKTFLYIKKKTLQKLIYMIT